MSQDSELLRRFLEDGDADAFRQLVERHVNLIYFTALRQTWGDAQLAEDAAQETFALLARRAKKLVHHTGLAGWLHVTVSHAARQIMRTERRRVAREQHMEIDQPGSANDEAWLKIRPVIDESLEQLSPEDRTAVLLRFFENRSFGEIGAELNLGENAVRMRVTRALGALEKILWKHGVHSSATMLASVLVVPAALAAPVGLASRLSAVAISTAVGTTTGAITFSFIKTMISSKMAGTSAALFVAIAGAGLYQNHLYRLLQSEHRAGLQREAGLLSSIQVLHGQLEAEKKRGDVADRDNEALVATSKSSMGSQASGPKTSVTPELTPESVQLRYQHAQDLARNGQNAAALEEFLWCYDTGMREASPLAAMRISNLLLSIADLGKTYPEALIALRERRDAARERFSADDRDTASVLDYGSINHALGEDDRTLEAFDKLSAEDPLRRFLGIHLTDQLLRSRRYSDMLAVTPVSDTVTMVEGLQKVFAENPRFTRDISILTSGVTKNIEAMAGTGDVSHAQELINQLVAFDHSPETHAALRAGLIRAGHPELIVP